jgi:hypothetical protein
MKKVSVFLLTTSFLFYHEFQALKAQPNFKQTSANSFDFEDDFSFGDSDLDNLCLQNIQTPITRGTSEENAAAWTIAIAALITDPNNVFNQSFYKKTSPIRIRPILEYPVALTYGYDLEDNSSMSCNLYLNVTQEKVFTDDSTRLDSYINIDSSNFIEGAFEGETIDLFAPIKVYEARIGGLIQGYVHHNKWNITMQLPLAYTARKLSLTDEEQTAVEESALGDMFEDASNGDIETFKSQHFGVDQFGFGDFKIKTTYQIYNSDRFNADFGGFVIFPTAVATKQGINGTWFEQENNKGYLNLLTIDPQDILNNTLTTQNKDDIKTFLLDVFDTLNSNILYSPLGNNGHVVFALSYNSEFAFSNQWTWFNDMSLQIPLLGQEQRYFKRMQTEESFLTEYTELFDSDDYTEFILFINQKIQDAFFPTIITTKVFPGLVFNSTNQIMYQHHDWDFTLGSNFWVQGEESIQNHNLSATGEQINSGYYYDIESATAARAWQEKLLGKINYHFESSTNSWAVGLYSDISILNSGIGNDFTIGLTLDGKF